MEFRLLTQEEYDRKLREVIVGTEGHHARVQNVRDNRATIGWGYTLNRTDNVSTWRQAGIELTAEQNAVLERVDRAPWARKTDIALTFDKVLSEQESDRLLRASIHEYEAPAVASGMPLSEERVAVVSVTYNRGPGVMRRHPVMDAIRDGDRAEAWFQMRYNCWGSCSAPPRCVRSTSTRTATSTCCSPTATPSTCRPTPSPTTACSGWRTWATWSSPRTTSAASTARWRPRSGTSTATATSTSWPAAGSTTGAIPPAAPWSGTRTTAIRTSPPTASPANRPA